MWLESTQVKASHSAFLSQAQSGHKNVTLESKSSHSAFLTQAKSSHKMCLESTHVKASHSAFLNRLKSKQVILPFWLKLHVCQVTRSAFLTRATSSHKTWLESVTWFVITLPLTDWEVLKGVCLERLPPPLAAEVGDAAETQLVLTLLQHTNR